MNSKHLVGIVTLLIIVIISFKANDDDTISEGPYLKDVARQEVTNQPEMVETNTPSPSVVNTTTEEKTTDTIVSATDFDDLSVGQEIDKEKNDRLEPYHVVLRRYGKRDCSSTQLADVDGEGVYKEIPKCIPETRIDDPHYLEEFTIPQLRATIRSSNVEEAAIAAHLLADRREGMTSEEKAHYGVNNFYELAVLFSGKPGSLIQFMNAGIIMNSKEGNKLKYEYMVIAHLMNYPGYDNEWIAEKGESFIRRGLSPEDIAKATAEAERRASEWMQKREQLAGGSTSKVVLQDGGDV